MRKIISIVLFLFVLLLSACSVQENMNPKLFLEKLAVINPELNLECSEQFYENNSYFCFVSDKNRTDFLIEILVNDSENVQKISLVCNQTDKAADFISCVRSIIETYAFGDNTDEILSALYENGEIKQKSIYYDTQWHNYISSASDLSVYFSVSSKKLIPESNAELTLKPNDRVDI